MTDAALAETHLSVVFFVGDRAYKLKKTVATPFVDLSTREAREAMCRREVELNRRLAPDVYLGVADVIGPDGSLCDHLLVMRRMPEALRLSTLVSAGAPAARCVRDVARAVSGFHASARRGGDVDAHATRDALRAKWEADLRETAAYSAPHGPLDGAVLDRVANHADRYLAGRGPLFAGRIAEGKAVDGHGDLLADDIFCLEDGPRILDCIEFDDGLRFGDVLADVAFLAMDLKRLGAPELATTFLQEYRELSADNWPASLADHYVAFRAHIRSKVACLRNDQHPSASAAHQARSLLEMADRHLTGSRVRLVLCGGLPGTGKTTLATAVGDERGWVVLRSDEIRRELFGPLPAAGYGAGRYDAAHTERTYSELLARAEAALAHGETVVADASWSSALHRESARRVARDTASDLVEVECSAPRSVTEARIAARHGDLSEATPLIAERMSADADPWPEAIRVDTLAELAHSARSVLAVADAV